MRTIICIVSLLLLVPGYGFHQKVYLTLSDAEKILGEKAHLTDSSSTAKKDTLEYKYTYTANATGKSGDRAGAIYFMIEKYSQVSAAANAYNSIMVLNQRHDGFKPVHDMGDEAYFHSDGQNFYFILVRKGDVMFRIKVNKITRNTSLEEFNAVAKKITLMI